MRIIDRIPLPVETFAGIAAGAVAHRVRPLPLPRAARPAGAACLVAGVALVATAWRERGAGSLDAPAALVTHGLHGRSRNPMHLGFLAVQAGVAGVTRNGWTLAALPLSAVLLHREVLREEAWLGDRFGAEYDAYRTQVRRYL